RVRGTALRAVVRMRRAPGAAAVHARLASPPVRWPCFSGIAFASRPELIANGLGIEEIARALGAASLGYITEEGMIAATEQPEEALCTACFSGKYPVARPEPVARAHGIHQTPRPGPALAGQDA